MARITGWTQEEVDYLISNLGIKSYAQIGLDLNRSKSAVTTKVSKLGYKLEPKYRFNVNFFDEIDTEEKAYWLGFIYADGWVHGDYNFGMEIKYTDREHLKKFNKAIDGNFEVRDRFRNLNGYSKSHPMSSIRIYSKYFVSSLISKGIVYRKSKIITFPYLEDKLIRHFIRGYFDGNGSISIDKRSQQLRCNFTCGSKSFLESIKFTFDLYTFSSSIREPDRNYFRLWIYGKESTKRFLDYIYRDAKVYLDRKYEFYLTNINLLKYASE